MIHGPDCDWTPPDWLISAGRFLGYTPIQTRWKAMNAARRLRMVRQQLATRSAAEDLQNCPSCSALQPVDGRGLAMVLIYFRMMQAHPGDGYLDWELDALIAHGALWPPAVQAGQWWRLGTACFVAYAAGFACGCLLGFAIRPLPLDERRGRVSGVSVAMGTIGGLAAVFFALLAIKPLSSSYALAALFEDPPPTRSPWKIRASRRSTEHVAVASPSRRGRVASAHAFRSGPPRSLDRHLRSPRQRVLF